MTVVLFVMFFSLLSMSYKSLDGRVLFGPVLSLHVSCYCLALSGFGVGGVVESGGDSRHPQASLWVRSRVNGRISHALHRALLFGSGGLPQQAQRYWQVPLPLGCRGSFHYSSVSVIVPPCVGWLRVGGCLFVSPRSKAAFGREAASGYRAVYSHKPFGALIFHSSFYLAFTLGGSHVYNTGASIPIGSFFFFFLYQTSLSILFHKDEKKSCIYTVAINIFRLYFIFYPHKGNSLPCWMKATKRANTLTEKQKARQKPKKSCLFLFFFLAT
jgi:hypothetical protein